MCKKLMFLISLVFVLGMVTSVYADDYDWTNDYPWSSLWISPWNWDDATPYGGPTDDDNAYIKSGPMGPVVDGPATAKNVRGPAWEGGGDQEIMLIKDCNLYVADRWEIKGDEGDPSISTITVADDAKVYVDGRMLNHGDRGKLVMNLTDNADFHVRKDFRVGDETEDSTEINLSGNAYMYVGNDDDGFRQNYGEAHLTVSENAIFECEFLRWRAKGAGVTITITVQDDALLIVNDDHMRMAGGGGDVVVNVLDRAGLDIDSDFRFGEDNGFGATATLNMSSTGTIFIGDSLNMIDDGSASGFSTANLTNGVVDIQEEVKADTDNWVINICGDAVVIMNGDQVDRTRDQEADGHWVACPGENCWGEIIALGTLMVDYNNVNVGRTTVWAETYPEIASSPKPEDGAVDVASVGTILCWCPGEATEVSHVFLSTDENEVINRDEDAYQAAVHEDNCFDPGVLQLCTTYYWAVDEQVGVVITDGPVWSFTVECCRTIEGFEDYTVDPDYIWDVWIDGCGDLLGYGGNATGSCVSLSIDTIHEGAKAMTYTYENDPYGPWGRDANYSEATRTFDPALNLTLTGEAALIVWFYGDSENTLTDMWLLINGGTTDMAVYGDNGENAADIQLSEWIDWNIDLAGFDAVNDVSTVSIGFGDRVGNIADDALGMVRFDDISVCPVRCVPKFIDNIIDLNDDCKSDMVDVKILCDNFLNDNR